MWWILSFQEYLLFTFLPNNGLQSKVYFFKTEFISIVFKFLLDFFPLALEKTFENICQSLAGVENSFSTQLAKLKDYKYSHPKRVIHLFLKFPFILGVLTILSNFFMQCFVIITSLCFSSAWIGHLVNNWVIGYLFGKMILFQVGS